MKIQFEHLMATSRLGVQKRIQRLSFDKCEMTFEEVCCTGNTVDQFGFLICNNITDFNAKLVWFCYEMYRHKYVCYLINFIQVCNIFAKSEDTQFCAVLQQAKISVLQRYMPKDYLDAWTAGKTQLYLAGHLELALMIPRKVQAQAVSHFGMSVV